MRVRPAMGRNGRRMTALAAGLLLAMAPSCVAPWEPIEDPAPASPRTRFSAERAFAHLEALAALGPRDPASPGHAQAQEYLRSQLSALGLEAMEQKLSVDRQPGAPPIELVNLAVTLEGEHDDVILLATRYDTRRSDAFRFVGANAGASGPALLLEMLRVLREDPLPYDVWAVFLDGESPLDGSNDLEKGFVGSRAFAIQLHEKQQLAALRLAVVFDQVGDSELRIERDLRSHSRLRDAFFRKARELGYEEAFPAGSPFHAVAASHLAFFNVGFRRVVAISDDRYGGSDPPGVFAGTEDDTPAHCSPQSLATVGEVSLATLRDLAEQMRKVDRFAPRPAAGDAASGAEAEVPSAGASEGADEAPTTDATSQP